MMIKEITVQGGTNSATGKLGATVTFRRLVGEDALVAVIDGFSDLLLTSGMCDAERGDQCSEIIQRIYWADDEGKAQSELEDEATEDNSKRSELLDIVDMMLDSELHTRKW